MKRGAIVALGLWIGVIGANAQAPATGKSLRKASVAYSRCLAREAAPIARRSSKPDYYIASEVIETRCQDKHGNFSLEASALYGLPIAQTDPRIDRLEAQIFDSLTRKIRAARQR